MEPSRWGIIYCPKDGVRHIHKEWEAIRSYLTEKGVLYDFVQSEGPKSVAAMLASNGYTTIIIVGGDAALNRALNGVLSQGEEVRRSVAFGVIPNGWGNDFAHFWGFEEDNYKQTIDWLIKRRIRKVDGLCAGADGGQPSPFLFELCERRSGGKHYEYQAQDTPFLGNADPFSSIVYVFVAVSAYGTQDAFQSEFG